MRFTIQMSCDNAAFAGDATPEVCRILRAIADRLERYGASGCFETILDGNGNDVGRFKLGVARD